jgi:hypothetical protein
MPLLAEDNRSFLREAFVHVQRPADLGDGIARALAPTLPMRESADRERDHLFYQLDGLAAARMKARIEELLAEGGHENAPDEPGH